VPRRAREARTLRIQNRSACIFASRRWFLPSQNQTSIRCHGPEGRHLRLSMCSLPVLKQSEGSLGRFISVSQSVSGRTWQSARCVILVLFRWPGFRPQRPCNLLQARNLVVLDQRRADMRPSCALPQASLDWRFLSISLFHRATQDRDLVGAPTSLPRSAQIGYSCCAVWKSACEPTSRLSFFRHRRVRSN